MNDTNGTGSATAVESAPVVTETNTQAVAPAETVAAPPATPEPPQSKEDKYWSQYYAGVESGDTPAAEPQADPMAQLATALSDLQAEIKNLKASGQTSAAAVAEAKQQKFIDYLKSGDFDGAEAYLEQKIKKNLGLDQPKVESDPKELTDNVMVMVRAENQMRDFTNELRRANPDLVQYEDLVTLKAEALFNKANATGRIKSADDYVAAYKQALNVAVDDIKKRFLRSRAEGKDEATTRTTEVLNSSAVTSNGVATHGDQNAKQDYKPQSIAEVIEARRQRIAQATGY